MTRYMNIGIVAPCAVPLVIGGAEKFWWGLERYINEHTPHAADIIKPPSPEHDFWSLIRSYRYFSALDLSAFDVIVSCKYPAWMVRHANHKVYMFHKLRGLYDAYPGDVRLSPELHAHEASSDLIRLCELALEGKADSRDVFDALDAFRASGQGQMNVEFPGPLSRLVVHALDATAFSNGKIQGFGALSREVAARKDYFPAGRAVDVFHPPTSARIEPGDYGDYLFTASRLDGPKRVELIAEAMQHVRSDLTLKIAGTGPQEDRLRSLAAADPRIELLGHVSETALAGLYANALAVAFVPWREDYGLITLEAMQAGKAVITTHDAGGPTELVRHEHNGLIVAPVARELGQAIDQLSTDRARARALGAAALETARHVSWEPLVEWLIN